MTKWRPWVALLLSALGLGVATYLTYSHYTDPTEKSLTCPLSTGHGSLINCQAVLTSAYSSVFGLPVAVYGAAFFVFMLVINLPQMWRSTNMWIARARLTAVCVGMVTVLYLVAVEFLALRFICVYCTSVHLLQFALFLLVVTGLNDTGYAASRWNEDEDEDEDEARDAAPQPVVASI